MTCPHCTNGTVTLFTSSRPCEYCTYDPTVSSKWVDAVNNASAFRQLQAALAQKNPPLDAEERVSKDAETVYDYLYESGVHSECELIIRLEMGRERTEAAIDRLWQRACINRCGQGYYAAGAARATTLVFAEFARLGFAAAKRR